MEISLSDIHFFAGFMAGWFWSLLVFCVLGKEKNTTLTHSQWVGLTQEEIDQLLTNAGFTRSDLLMVGACVDQVIDLVTNKLKEKNT